MEKTYVAIDLKSFYASAECVDRGLDPLTTNLVVADPTRTEKTICLAVTPSLKSYGIPGRARLFEVIQKVEEVNKARKQRAPGGVFTGSSVSSVELNKNRSLSLDYVVAPPRMAHYMEVSSGIYDIYLKYVAPEDIHVYSIDEVFIDATPYLKTYKLNAKDFAMMLIKDVLETTGITATAGIGTNLYLCKIAMDIEAKHMPADENGVRIAQLNEKEYREKLWDHQPLTDFWRLGHGYASKLSQYGMLTMGDVALMSIKNEDLLYKLFGVNAELLIDHAWGWEPTTISQIKKYKPESNSISSGQVLSEPYDFDKGKLVVREMADQLVLELVDKKYVTDQMVLTVGYDIDNVTDSKTSSSYSGPIKKDWYGRNVPKQAHGSINLPFKTSSSSIIVDAVMDLYDRIVNKKLSVRRMYVVAANIVREETAKEENKYEQLDLFTDYEALEKENEEIEKKLGKERNMQEALLDIKKKYGKNAILKGMNLKEGATQVERNGQVGGHKA